MEEEDTPDTKTILEEREVSLICVSILDSSGKDLRFPFTVFAGKESLTNKKVKEIIWNHIKHIRNKAFCPIQFEGIKEFHYIRKE
jgi:hypothetical protein